MKKAKSLISLNPSMLSCLFFVVVMLFTTEVFKKILNDIFTASSSEYPHIKVATGISQLNG